jgi:hypothetical protein
MINFLNFKIKNLKKKDYFIFFFFILILIVLNLIFIKYWIISHPYQIDNYGNIINRIQFYFEQPLDNLLNNKPPTNTIAEIEFKISKMPLLIYFLYYFQIYISKNFIIIHLFKNIFLSSIIFILIKKYDIKLNNLFLICCLLLIYSIPHNIVSMLAITPEESILIYFVIILFFLITGEYKFRNYYIAIIVSLIFFTKGSMFYLSFGISLIYFIYEKKKQKLLPLIFVIFCSIIWGLNSYYKTGKFAFATSTTSLNGLTTGIVFHKDFTKSYPLMNPDIYWSDVFEEIKNKNIKDEWQADKYIREKSIKYILENPADVFYGILKKLYVILISPYKDTRTEEQLINEYYKNPIRFSNFINKPVFIISIIILLYSISNFRKVNSKIKKISIYYLSILVFYFFPYLAAYIFPRHCVAMYILGFIYILFFFTYHDNYKIVKKFFLKKNLKKIN